jgi:hypothetical protein
MMPPSVPSSVNARKPARQMQTKRAKIEGAESSRSTMQELIRKAIQKQTLAYLLENPASVRPNWPFHARQNRIEII